MESKPEAAPLGPAAPLTFYGSKQVAPAPAGGPSPTPQTGPTPRRPRQLSAEAKVWLKENVPSGVLRSLRLMNAVRMAYNYWVPYNFIEDGSAWAPKEITLDVTYICNLKCEMCPQAIDFERADSNLLKQYKSRKEMTTEQILKLIDDCADYGVKVFTITGGEPFLRKDMLTLIERVKNRGMEMRLLTNGMLIKQATAARLVELGVEKITISVDGPEHVHNTIRKNKQSFRKLIEAVKMIQEEKQKQGRRLPYLSFANTISASNAHNMSELMDVAGQHGVNVGFSYMYYVSEEMENKTAEILKIEPAKGEDYRMPEELKKIEPSVIRQQMAEVFTKAKKYNIKASFNPPLTPEQARERYQDDRAAYAEKCFYVWNHARVNPYGDVYACGPISISMGNVTEQGLSKIWNNDAFKQFRVALRDRRLFPKCAKCCALSNTTWKYLPVLRA